MYKIDRFITIIIPNNKCNLRCEYCYITQLRAWDEPRGTKFTPEHIARCLSRERLGGTAMINFTGNGETLLQPDLPDIVEAVLREGHFVEIVTNAVPTARLLPFLELDPDLLARLMFKISFHYKELVRLGILDHFFDNVRRIREAGASFTLELMAYDAIEGDLPDIMRVCRENVGACCHSTIGRDESTKRRTLLTQHSREEFQRIWEPLDSTMMRVKFDLLDVKRREFCYAGQWSLFVNLYTGDAQSCYWIPSNQNIFDDPERPIKWRPVGHACPQPFCINGHAHMAWGLIPKVSVPTYREIRDRECEDGTHWLTPECREFYSTRLYESHRQWGRLERVAYTISEPFRLAKWFVTDGETKVRVKKYIDRYVLHAHHSR